MNSEIVVPLMHKSRPIGALNILSRNAISSRDRDVAIVRQFAAHVAVALVNARLFERSRRDAEAFETLAEIGREVASVLDLDQLFARIAQLTKRVIDYRTFGIFLLDEERGELEMKLAVQYGEKVEVPRIRLGEGLIGYAALHGEPVLVADVSQDPRYINLVPDVRSELAIPLLLKDRCIGVVDLESPELDAFTKRDVEILTLLASQAAVAIENARSLRRSASQRGAAREGAALRAARADGAAAGGSAQAAERDRSRGGVRTGARARRGFPRLPLARSPTRWWWRWEMSRAKAFRRRLYSAFAAELVRGRTFRRRYLPGSIESRGRAFVDQHDPRSSAGSRSTTARSATSSSISKRRVMTLANSGLPYPIRCSADLCAQIELPGVPLGSFQGSTYDESPFALHTGDLFVLCTDGVYEAMNAARAGVHRRRGSSRSFQAFAINRRLASSRPSSRPFRTGAARRRRMTT